MFSFRSHATSTLIHTCKLEDEVKFWVAKIYFTLFAGLGMSVWKNNLPTVLSKTSTQFCFFYGSPEWGIVILFLRWIESQFSYIYHGSPLRAPLIRIRYPSRSHAFEDMEAVLSSDCFSFLFNLILKPKSVTKMF